MEENKDLELVKELLEKKQYTKLRQMLSDKNTADIGGASGGRSVKDFPYSA